MSQFEFEHQLAQHSTGTANRHNNLVASTEADPDHHYQYLADVQSSNGDICSSARVSIIHYQKPNT